MRLGGAGDVDLAVDRDVDIAVAIAVTVRCAIGTDRALADGDGRRPHSVQRDRRADPVAKVRRSRGRELVVRGRARIDVDPSGELSEAPHRRTPGLRPIGARFVVGVHGEERVVRLHRRIGDRDVGVGRTADDVAPRGQRTPRSTVRPEDDCDVDDALYR